MSEPEHHGKHLVVETTQNGDPSAAAGGERITRHACPPYTGKVESRTTLRQPPMGAHADAGRGSARVVGCSTFPYCGVRSTYVHTYIHTIPLPRPRALARVTARVRVIVAPGAAASVGGSHTPSHPITEGGTRWMIGTAREAAGMGTCWSSAAFCRD